MGRLDEAVEKALKARESSEAALAHEAAAEKTVSAPMRVRDPGAGRPEMAPPKSLRSEILISRERDFAAFEEMARLKFKVVNWFKDKTGPRSLLVTSSTKGEGKSFTAFNLAASIAKDFDSSALLIDADLRKPSLHSFLGMKEGPGLIQLLSGDAEFSDVVVRTGIGKLDFIQAGGRLQNPVEFLTSARSRQALDEICGRYPDRYVIIDSPPLLAFAETHSLAQSAAAVVLVVRQGVTGADMVRKSAASLKDAELLGLVLNGFNESSHRSHYGDYYGYGPGKGGKS